LSWWLPELQRKPAEYIIKYLQTVDKFKQYRNNQLVEVHLVEGLQCIANICESILGVDKFYEMLMNFKHLNKISSTFYHVQTGLNGILNWNRIS